MDSPAASVCSAAPSEDLSDSSTKPSNEVELTPRSKVRALLALSDDSDFDSPTKQKAASSSRKASPGKTPSRSSSRRPSVRATSSGEQSMNETASDAESDILPVKRVGKIVARLRRASEAPKNAALNDSPAELEADVTPRIQKMDDKTRSFINTPQKETADLPSVASSPHLFVSPHSNITPAVDMMAKLRELAPKTKMLNKRNQDRAERNKPSEESSSGHSASENEEADVEVEDRLTQQTRLSKRKASKKALEEMHRETQRMARNQQLSHQVKVRKKITKLDLFQRFNFKVENAELAPQSPEKLPDKSSEDELMMSGALQSSDAEVMLPADTPPTSPANEQIMDKASKLVKGQLAQSPEIVLQALKAGPPMEQDLNAVPVGNKSKYTAVKTFKVTVPDKNITYLELSDDDDELEVVRPNKALVLLNHLPVDKKKDSSHLLRLRHLANLTSPGRKRKHGSHLTATELQIQLREKARQQAMNDKAERIAQLRAKGIHVQTFEEREKEQLELENLLEKARVDAVDIAKKEKAAAKKAGLAVDDDDLLDDDDDEDWDGEDEAEQSDVELAMSGSEDEEDDEQIDRPDEGCNDQSFFQNEAEESDEDISENIMEVFSIFKKKPAPAKAADLPPEGQPIEAIAEVPQRSDIDIEISNATLHMKTITKADAESEDEAPVAMTARPTRRKVVVDDDDEDQEAGSHNQMAPSSTQKSPNDVARAAFGFASPPIGFGLSQLLDSTLAAAASQEQSQKYDQEQDSLAFLREIPAGSAPQFPTPSVGHTFVPDSQRAARTSHTQDKETQVQLGISQLQDFESTSADVSPMKFSQLIEPTQDAGFVLSRFPQAKEDEPTSTVDTVALDQSPVLKRKGRLMRRSNVIAELSDTESETDDESVPVAEAAPDAFDALFNGAKKSAAKFDFDKNKSAAKELVEEQAEESEDEYAGLGGASDDESTGEVDEEMRKMMDDSHVDVNEQALQALHADKQRLEDEKRLNQLYKDITTGRLRRKRGAAAMDDLSDHEDDAAERRRKKQEEFARMRRALLADEKIGKIAQNPKQQAFFHAIEDRDELDGLDYMDRDESAINYNDKQETDSAPQAPMSNEAQIESSPEHKGASITDDIDDKENIPPRNPRRVAANESVSRPTTLAEIRESLSFFLDDSVPETQLDEDDEAMEDLAFGQVLQRSDTNASVTSISSKNSIVNRLVRTDSEDSMNALPLAFQTGSQNAGPTFKVPSLLRRATNLSTASNSSTGTISSARSTETSVRMGGSRKSNIHYQAREAERRRLVDVAEQKRKAQVKRTVMSNKGRSIFGLLRKESSGFE